MYISRKIMRDPIFVESLSLKYYYYYCYLFNFVRICMSCYWYRRRCTHFLGLGLAVTCSLWLQKPENPLLIIINFTDVIIILWERLVSVHACILLPVQLVWTPIPWTTRSQLVASFMDTDTQVLHHTIRGFCVPLWYATVLASYPCLFSEKT